MPRTALADPAPLAEAQSLKLEDTRQMAAEELAAELERPPCDVAPRLLTVSGGGPPEVADGVLHVGATVDRVAWLLALSQGREGVAPLQGGAALCRVPALCQRSHLPGG